MYDSQQLFLMSNIDIAWRWWTRTVRQPQQSLGDGGPKEFGSPQQLYGDARPDVADGRGDRGAVVHRCVEARLGFRGVSIFHS